MEAERDKLIVLVYWMQDKAAERNRGKLINLGNEPLYNNKNVLSMAQMLKRDN
jgi:hypothetical protein